jgi:hypothetical protein
MNKILSNKSVLLIATMLSTMMLATSSMASLAPITAFAQEDVPDMEALLTQVSPDSTSEEDTTANEEDTTANEEDTTANEEDTSDNAGTGDVVVDPVVETAAEADTNVNADTHVITDEEDCDEANDEVNQANDQSADLGDRSEGEVGDNGLFVAPKVQTAAGVGLNLNVDTDVVLVDGCNPSDDLNQANDQSVDETTGNDLEAGEDSTIVDPTRQVSNLFAQNIGVDNDVVRPVL